MNRNGVMTNMALYIAGYAVFIVLMVLVIIGFTNQYRAGARIAAGYIRFRQHMLLLALSVAAIVMWATLMIQDSYSYLIVFAWLPVNLFVTPSVLGENGLKGGLGFIPRDQLLDYSIEADGRSPVKVHFKVQGQQERVVMKVYTKQAAELDQKLAQYFQARSAQ
ncbi:hypothetical protein [Paenibacillus kobensis]|uniref:hypothetical protein n=1 Tax=Paenibacillus kobensis TaxID=59841 RepID=UPI000FDCC942|nr:hypothetical protein [Paenibacillus kobensis]